MSRKFRGNFGVSIFLWREKKGVPARGINMTKALHVWLGRLGSRPTMTAIRLKSDKVMERLTRYSKRTLQFLPGIQADDAILSELSPGGGRIAKLIITHVLLCGAGESGQPAGAQR